MASAIHSTCDVAIVGGGAAGLATGIFLGQLTTRLRVIVLEGARKPGAKILVSGGSRCNVTNATVRETDFWSAGRASVIRRVLRALPVADSVEWFRAMGVSLHEEEDGKLFPDSNRSKDVLQALLRETTRLGIDLWSGARVERVERSASGGFVVSSSRGSLGAARVVLATGGRSLPKTGSDGIGYTIAEQLGHRIVATTPGLAPLLLAPDAQDRPWYATLSGVSQAVEVAVWIDGSIARRFAGPMLWTHFGVSGPAALNASRHWERARVEGRDVRVTVSFAPGWTFDRMDAHLTTLASQRPQTIVASALGSLVPAAVASALARQAGLDSTLPLSRLTRTERRRLTHALLELNLGVVASRGYSFAEVTAGGVDLSEIDSATMESRVCRGLFLVGEILDVDGRLGGYNFQWAWSSARVAARALARESELMGVGN